MLIYSKSVGSELHINKVGEEGKDKEKGRAVLSPDISIMGQGTLGVALGKQAIVSSNVARILLSCSD